MSIALITGASGGIGSAAAERLAAAGRDICAGYCNSKESAETLCRRLRSEYGVRAEAVRFDLSDPSGLRGALGECISLLGEPEILINNGGREHIGLFQDMTDSELVTLMNSDLVGTMLLTKAVLPQMIARKHGYIINVASVWGEVGASCEVAYSAAKAGLIGFTKAIARETAPSGVIVNAVSPGFIDTKMNRQLSEQDKADLIADIPADRAGKPQDVAEAIEFLCSGRADYIVGQVIRIDGGWI